MVSPVYVDLSDDKSADLRIDWIISEPHCEDLTRFDSLLRIQLTADFIETLFMVSSLNRRVQRANVDKIEGREAEEKEEDEDGEG